MLDPRIDKLAGMLINYSCALKKGEKILVEAIDVPHEFSAALARHAAKAGGHPLVMLKSNQINRVLMEVGQKPQWDAIARVEKLQMQSVQCYIGARGSPNVSELSDVTAEKQKLYESTVWEKVHRDVRITKTRWCVLRWPHAVHGPDGRDEHRGLRGFLFQRLHARLRQNEPGHAATEKADGENRSRPTQRTGRNRPVVQHQKHPGHLLRRQGQYPRRRSLHRAGQNQRQRRDPLQLPHHLPRHHAQRCPPGLPRWQNRRGDQHRPPTS